MRKRSIALWVGLAAVVFAMAWAIERPREPVYKGSRVTEWLQARDQYRREEAEEAVRQIGSNAIPSLIRMLQAKDSFLRAKFVELVGKQEFINLQLGNL